MGPVVKYIDLINTEFWVRHDFLTISYNTQLLL